MELPECKVIEVHYWAVLIKDKFHPDGEEWPTRFKTKEEAFKTKEEAEAKLQRLRDIKITRS